MFGYFSLFEVSESNHTYGGLLPALWLNLIQLFPVIRPDSLSSIDQICLDLALWDRCQ